MKIRKAVERARDGWFVHRKSAPDYRLEINARSGVVKYCPQDGTYAGLTVEDILANDWQHEEWR